MPLPVRSTSVRNANAETRLTVPRTAQNIQARRTQPLRTSKLVNEETSAASEPTESSVDGSETSSRIPSPFKRNPSSENNARPRAEVARPNQRPIGHSRQRSTATSTTDSRPKFGHSRSISTVSTNTSTTSHTAYTANTSSTSGSDQLKASTFKPRIGNIARPLSLSTRTKAETPLRTTNPSALSRSVRVNPFEDNLQSELLQLAIVYDESSRGLQKYQKAVEQSLDCSRAELKAVRDDVLGRQQVFYHALNLEAVNVWLQEYGYQGTCQLIQNLSVAVRDLTSLEHIFGGEDGLAAVFQAWEQGMTANQVDDFPLYEDVRVHLEFDQHLGPELRRFKQQIASVQRIFSNLPISTSESALSTVLKLHISLANIFHQQCQIMLLTGETLVTQRERWITSETIDAINDYTDFREQRRVASFLR